MFYRSDHHFLVSGIGKAISLRLAKEGCHIWTIGRNEQHLQEVATECKTFGVNAGFSVVDLSVHGQPALLEAVNTCVSKLGGINILINNAGLFTKGNTTEDWSEWLKVMEVDLISVMHCTKLVLPHIEKEADHKRGAIINIGSIAGKLKMSNVPYVAAKHGIDGFSGALFENVREKGIKVTELFPGFVRTDMVAGDHLDGSKMTQPDDIADIVAFAIKFPDTSCLTEIEIRPQRSPYKKS